MTTKFSTRQPIQKTPWVCKRSPPCLPKPPPVDEQSTISITIMWKQPPFAWPVHPGWYYRDRFLFTQVAPDTLWWQGQSKTDDQGHVWGELRWRPVQQQYRLAYQFHPLYVFAVYHAVSIYIDLPETPFFSGPHVMTDIPKVAKILSSILAPT